MRTHILTFFNQKGGVGKSNLTNVVANEIIKNFKRENINVSVLVIDADKQLSIKAKRNKDLNILSCDLTEAEADFKLLAQRTRKRYSILNNDTKLKWKPYVLCVVKDSETERKALSLIDSGEYDYVLIDFPGTTSQEYNAELYDRIEHLFIPTSHTDTDIAGTGNFISFISKYPPKNIRTVNLVFNKFEIQKTALFNKAEHTLENYGYKFLNSRIRDLSYFDTSSVIPITTQVNLNTVTIEDVPQYSEVTNLTDEIINIILESNA